MKFSTASVMMFLCGQNFAKTAFAFGGGRPMAASRAIRVLSSAATEEVAASASEEKDSPEPQKLPPMEEIVSLCKRRGIIFPSSEIYNGYAGFFDYGPLGSELKKNLKDVWWKHFVTRREDVVGLDSSIIHNPTTWKSSGTFNRKWNSFWVLSQPTHHSSCFITTHFTRLTWKTYVSYQIIFLKFFLSFQRRTSRIVPKW